MRSAFVPTLVLALLPCLVAAQGPPDIRALEDALARGLTTRARSQLESLLAPDFVLRGQPDIDRET